MRKASNLVLAFCCALLAMVLLAGMVMVDYNSSSFGFAANGPLISAGTDGDIFHISVFNIQAQFSTAPVDALKAFATENSTFLPRLPRLIYGAARVFIDWMEALY